MRPAISLLINFIILSLSTAEASEINFDYDAFTNQYFEKWNKTQKPGANKQDLENYLSLLTEDVAWQHLPYQPNDERKPDGKQNLRQGMTRWLAANTKYKAELIDMMFGDNVVIIKFTAKLQFNDNDGNVVNKERHYTDVLELENGKVCIIRRYGK